MRKKSRTSSGPATPSGSSPALIACAARTISERAAWRKTSVSRVAGTARAPPAGAASSSRSSSTRPGPTGASWSTSPTSRTWVRGPTAASSASARWTDSIDASSTISTSQPSIGCVASRVKPSSGAHSSRRWIVVASTPVSSLRRRAALPVGAHSRALLRCALSRSTSVRIVALLPVPGTAGEDREAVLERLRHAAPLVVAGDEGAARGPLHVAQRQRRLVVEQPPRVPGQPLLDRVQARLGDPPGAVDDDPAARRQHVDRLVDVDAAAEQARRARQQLGAGEMAVAVGLRLVERVQHAGRQPVGGVERGVERARERVGGGEADPVELADRVGLALQAGDRAGAEVARDPARRRGVDAVRVEKQAQLAQLALVAPGLHRAAEPPRADAGHAAQHALGVAVDRREHLAGAVALDEQRGAARTDVLDGLQVGRRPRRR